MYRLQFGSAHSTLPTAELTLGVINLNAEELLEKIEEAYVAHVGHK